jgi:hypothetical protein
MTARPLRPAAVAAAVALTLALGAAAPSSAAVVDASRYVGSYLLTEAGSNVERIELRVARGGKASITVNSSRYTQRPTASSGGGPVVETGTWHVSGGKLVVHIDATSQIAGSDRGDAPQFSDLSFVLEGCSLHRVTDDGSGITFEKRHCS